MSTALHQVSLQGVISCSPEKIIRNHDNKNFSKEEVKKLIESTGVLERRALVSACTSDLCYVAAKELLVRLSWDPCSVDGLIFVSQTPDYYLPATACVLQHRLDLASHVMAFDVNLGCSGYVYGLIVASSLISSGVCKRVLLLAGDTPSKIVSDQDRSVAFLFGDAGSATALELDKNASPIFYNYGTDGEGYDKLMVKSGSFRHRASEDSFIKKMGADGNVRSDCDIYMSGADVFSFSLKRVPASIDAALTAAGWQRSEVDYFFLHQANSFMLKHLAKKMQIPLEKIPLVLEKYGNTSAASIPLVMTEALSKEAPNRFMKLVFSGFGVGFSWASIAFAASQPRVMSSITYVEE